MKTLIFSITLFITTTLAASINPLDLVVNCDQTSNTIVLRTTVEVGTLTTVKILDREEVVVHSLQLDAGDFLNMRFRLSSLPVGDYSVVITDFRGETRQPVTITAGGIESDINEATRTIFPRVVLREGRKLTLNYHHANAARVDIKLADDLGGEIINEHVNGEQPIDRTYDLGRLPAGNYFVTVSSPNVKTYSTSITLE